jgi:hypothetical protein
MSSVTLVHPEEMLTVSAVQAATKCRLFQKNPTLLISPYRIQSPVSLSLFREFVSALEGNTVNLTDTNFTGLQRLCEEFGFDECAAKLSKFSQPSKDSQGRQLGSPLAGLRSALLNESFQFIANGITIKSSVAEAAALFPAVREQLSVDGCGRKFFLNDSEMKTADIGSLQFFLSGEAISIARSQFLQTSFFGKVNLERQFLGFSKADIRMNLSDLTKERQIDLESADLSVLSVEALDNLLSSESISVESEDALLHFILKLGPGYRDLLRHIEIGFLSKDGLSLLEEDFEIPPESLWQCAAERIAHPPFLFDSRIISDFPEIFAEFQGKHFEILWRGSRDGFGASEFHRRCDGQANTLTVILDTKGNIFGGFTPVKWESRVWNGMTGGSDNCFKADDSQKSFLFTLKNPHNIPARRFALKAEMKHQALYCRSGFGPVFYCGIGVSDNCDTNTKSWTQLGFHYINSTLLQPNIVFTGSQYFQVKEIDVFKIAA